MIEVAIRIAARRISVVTKAMVNRRAERLRISGGLLYNLVLGSLLQAIIDSGLVSGSEASLQTILLTHYVLRRRWSGWVRCRIRMQMTMVGMSRATVHVLACGQVDKRMLIIHFVRFGRSRVGERNIVTTVVITEVNHVMRGMDLMRLVR